jgi:hypothetical protein
MQINFVTTKDRVEKFANIAQPKTHVFVQDTNLGVVTAIEPQVFSFLPPRLKFGKFDQRLRNTCSSSLQTHRELVNEQGLCTWHI